MNGNSLFLDTNAFIYFFEGKQKVTDLVIATPTIYFSVIAEIELLSFEKLTKKSELQIKKFLSGCQKVFLNQNIVNRSISLKKEYKIKVPDAIIAASAIELDTPLISADKDLRKIKDLKLIFDI